MRLLSTVCFNYSITWFLYCT